MRFETRAIHIGEEPNLKDGASGDVAMPIHLATTYARKETDIPTSGYEYARSENPTRNALEQRLASLENAKYGLAFASGMAAVTTVFLSLLKSEDHVIAFDDLYGGSRRLFSRIFVDNFAVEVSFVDARNVENVKRAIKSNTKMIWLESPTNPLLKLCDIKAISELGKQHKLITVVDNTFMSSYFQQPLALGADIVMHSTTKYMNGHSDSVGGALMLNENEMFEKLKFTQKSAGGILAPFDSYLVLRGTKTLAIRMEAHQKNALKIAKYLETHPKVKKVIYPGLESHPQYELAKTQMSGFGGMLSFELDGDINQARTFVESLKYFALAESLGGVESLIELLLAMLFKAL